MTKGPGAHKEAQAKERIQDKADVRKGDSRNPLKVAVDRVGKFFSQPPSPVRINLHPNNVHHVNRQSPNSRQHHSNNHNVRTIQQQYPQRPHNPPQHQIVRPISPPVHHRAVHNAHPQPSKQILAQLKALEINSDIPKDSQQSLKPEVEGSTAKPLVIEDPILVNFEDLEEMKKKSKFNRSAFIDPSQLENFSDTPDQHEGGDHDGNTGHHGDEEGDHEGSHNSSLTQADDPHNKDKQFCVDISEYLDLKWVLKDSEECHVTFSR